MLLGLLLIVVLVLAVQGAIPQFAAGSGALAVERTETISEDVKGNERASVEIRFGTGTLNINGLSEGSSQLIQGTVDLSRSEQLNKDYSGSNGVARLVLASQGSWNVGPEVLGGSNKKWSLSLNRDLPLDLTINSGAGPSNLDLTSLNLRRFDLNAGVGQATVKLPTRGRYSVEIDGGVGQVIIIVPQGLAARFQTDGGLGGREHPGRFPPSGRRIYDWQLRFGREPRGCQSPGWCGADYFEGFERVSSLLQ